jgi:hypothetical protein
MERKRTTFLALIAAFLTLGVLWYNHRSQNLKEVTWDDVVVEAREGGYRIITTAALWERYQKNAKDLLLVDTRQEWEYETGHIKGAFNFPIEPTFWSMWRKKGSLETFLGSDKNRFIIFY